MVSTFRRDRLLKDDPHTGIIVVWVPDSNLLDVTEETGPEVADQVIRSLEDFIPEQWGLPPYDS